MLAAGGLAASTACGPADKGFTVEVVNDCSEAIKFSLGGGQASESASSVTLSSGEDRAYTVLAGGDEGGFASLESVALEPRPRTIVEFDRPPDGKAASLAATGNPCVLTAKQPVDEDEAIERNDSD